MKWLLIVLLFTSSPDSVWASATKNACIANLMQINGAVQQWLLENRLAETNRYSLGDTNITIYLKHGTLPECPNGGVYVAGRTAEYSPRCTFHGSVEGQDYWWKQTVELEDSLFSAQLVMGIAAMSIGLFVVAFFKKAVTEKRVLLVRSQMIQPVIMFGAALLASQTRFFFTEEYRWHIFLCFPMIVFAVIGLLMAVVGGMQTKGHLRGYFVLMAVLNFMLCSPILFGVLSEVFGVYKVRV